MGDFRRKYKDTFDILLKSLGGKTQLQKTEILRGAGFDPPVFNVRKALQLSDSEWIRISNLVFTIESEIAKLGLGSTTTNFARNLSLQIQNGSAQAVKVRSILDEISNKIGGLNQLGQVWWVGNRGLFYAQHNKAWTGIGLTSIPIVIPETPTIIDGTEIFPSKTYTATLISKLTGEPTASGLFSGSKLIALLGTNVTIKIGISTRIIVPESQLVPKNPFIRVGGEKIFQKEQEGKRVIRVVLKERISAADKARIRG